jgi:hypothetical protein
LKVKHAPAGEVRHLLTCSARLRRVAWQPYRVQDGEKGPMIWEAKRVPFWIKDEPGLPVGPYHLLIARSVLDPAAVKFFLSNAPPRTPTAVLLLVAFRRWPIERLFEDSQSKLGLDHFEVRQYRALQRHLLLTCVSHLFLAEVCRAQKKRRRTDGVPGADGDAAAGAALEPGWALLPAPGGRARCFTDVNADPQRRRPAQSLPENAPAFTGGRHRPAARTYLPVAEEIAL